MERFDNKIFEGDLAKIDEKYRNKNFKAGAHGGDHEEDAQLRQLMQATNEEPKEFGHVLPQIMSTVESFEDEVTLEKKLQQEKRSKTMKPTGTRPVMSKHKSTYVQPKED